MTTLQHDPTLWLQPSPDIAALRAACADAVGYTPLSAYMDADAMNSEAAEDAAHLAYVELSMDDKRSLIGVGCTVRYSRQSYGHFDGIVVETCAETDRCLVRFEDEFGVRAYWLGLSYLQLLLCAAAANVDNGVGS